MQEVGYRSWGLVLVDSDPSSGVPTATHPPMISTLALDRGASLVVELTEPLTEIHLRMRLTAFSTEGETGSNMHLSTAHTAGKFNPLSTEEWAKSFESMDAVFEVRLLNVGQFLKIHSQASTTLIISTVTLSVP